MPRSWSEARWRREVRAEVVRQLKARDWRLTRKRMAEVPRPTSTTDAIGVTDTTPAPSPTFQLLEIHSHLWRCLECPTTFNDLGTYLAHDIEAHLPARVAALRLDPPRQKGWTA